MSDEKPLQSPDTSHQVQLPGFEKELANSLTDSQADNEEVGEGATFKEANYGLPNRGQNRRDAAADDTTFEKQLRIKIEELRAQKLPAMTSGTSIMWKNLLVRGAGAGLTYQETVGEVLKGPVIGVKKLLSRKASPEKTILYDFNGVLRDGEMLLVLGRPGSGCSTLLKSLAGFTEEYLGWQGDIKYNGVDIEVIKKRFRGDAVYISEVDTHFPHLRVNETLNFVSETKTPRLRPEGQRPKDFVSSTTDMYVTGLGLSHTLQTKVGSDFVRGISGGERRRVSLAELLATGASTGYFDNPSRGLDASTSLELIRMIRAMCTNTRYTAIMALYQAGESLAQEFDKVTVLYRGHQIFFGAVKDAKVYFEDLGFLCPPGQTTADFLTAITDPVATRVKEGWATRVPRASQDFVRIWKESQHYAQLMKDIQKYETEFGEGQQQLRDYESYSSMLKAKHQRPNSIFRIDLRTQLIANLKRAYYRMIGDKTFLVSTALATVFMSIIMGSLFFDTPNTTSGFFSKGGVLFFSILFNALNTLSEVGTLFAQRPIVERQKKYAMYHPFIDALGSMFAEYPYKIVTITLFDIVIYFMANLKQDVGAFFIFWLTTYLATLATSAYFRMVAASTKQFEPAAAVAGISVLVFAIYTGYVIPRTDMHPWFKWISYVDPLSYAFEILMANEFHNVLAPCSTLVPSGPGYQNASLAHQVCAVTGAKPEHLFVSGDAYIAASFDYHYSHVWRNIGILCAFIIGFVAIFTVVTEYNSLSAGMGEFLIFRRGHEPENVQKVLAEGSPPHDVEMPESGHPLTEFKSTVSEVHGLVKSKEVFTWESISYDISLSDGQIRRLLNGISGYVKPGTLTALMGESGAGKTTLLNVLAQRINTGVIGGNHLVNGFPPGRSFQRRTGYVQQQDLHLQESTVREALRFSAILRQPEDVPLQEKHDYVERVIEIMEMSDFAEAVIGAPGKGLNVEQRKRTTIAVELVAKPALLLFLDEPTSGLDSQSAYSIVRLLRKLANSGQAILCTIHQPSSVLFEQFDRLLLLKKGGMTVYFGDIGKHSRKVVQYFEANGAFQCPADANAAEYILDVIGAGATATVDRDWSEVWRQTQENKQMVAKIKALKEEYGAGSSVNSTEDEAPERDYAVSWFTQYRNVQSRLYLHYWRNPVYVMGKVMLNIMAGLLIGFTFYKEDKSAQGLQNKLFAIFMSLILAMPLIQQLQPRFVELAQLFIAREKPSKMYHWTTFVLSAPLVEIPYNIITGSIYFIIWYFAVGFYHNWPPGSSQRGAYMWLLFMTFQMWLSTFGLAMAALAPNAETAAVFTTLFASFVISFSGVLQPLSRLLTFYHWVYWVSPYHYLVEGLMATAVHGVPVVCAPKEINYFSPPPGQTCGEYAGKFVEVVGNLLNPNATADCAFCRYKDSDQYLATVNISYSHRWRDLGLMFVYVLFNIGLAFAFFYLTKVRAWNMTGLARVKARFGRS